LKGYVTQLQEVAILLRITPSFYGITGTYLATINRTFLGIFILSVAPMSVKWQKV